MFSSGNVTVGVANMDRAVRFYTETLGLKLAYRFGDHWASVELGKGLTIGLHPVSGETLAGRRGSMAIGLELSGSIEDATRYYHNAMYGVWNSNPDANRNKARIELIQFLLKKNAGGNAESELMALANSLPATPDSHLEAARLFAEAQDYPSALAQDEEVLRLDPTNATALSAAGQAAYRTGNYATAERYLRAAVAANPQDAKLRQLLETTQTVLRASPFRTHLSDAERNRRIIAAFAQAEDRLANCAQQTGEDINSTTSTSLLARLQTRWSAAKPDLKNLRSPGETDLPDAIMDIVFQIEQQTVALCGQPQGLDLALLLISRERAAASQ